MLVYRLFTGVELSYRALLLKLEKEEYFLSRSHRARAPQIRQFLDYADMLFIGDIDLQGFL